MLDIYVLRFKSQNAIANNGQKGDDTSYYIHHHNNTPDDYATALFLHTVHTSTSSKYMNT